MTRRDTIIKWIAYGLALILLAILNYYILGPLPIALPLLMPMAAVAVGTLEGAGFAAGAVMWGLGHGGGGLYRRTVHLRLDRRPDHPVCAAPGRVGPPAVLHRRRPGL